MSYLISLLTRLAVAAGAPPDAAAVRAFEAKIIDDELEGADAAPAWLLDLLSAFASQTPTSAWVPFEVRGLEASNSFDFLRGLDQILPVEVIDAGERYTVVEPVSGFEAIVAFEGYLYLVKPIDEPEPSA